MQPDPSNFGQFKRAGFVVEHHLLMDIWIITIWGRLNPDVFCVGFLVFRGDLIEPIIEEYEVGPLPHPTSYMLIKRPYWRHPIPYNVRSPTADADTFAWHEFICRELTKVSKILETVTGYTYSADCLHHCLTYRWLKCRIVRVLCWTPHSNNLS